MKEELKRMLERSVLAIEPGALEELLAAAELEIYTAIPKPEKQREKRDAIAVLPLSGYLTPRSSFWSQLFGGTGLKEWRNQLAELAGDPEVAGIVLRVDSPGGSVGEVEEAAADVYVARHLKPVVAAVDGLAASAAYWIASQAERVLVTPSGDVGSIGVYMVHFDQSAAMDQIGIRPTIISAGKYKVEGNPYEPLAEEAKEALQERADATYGRFVADVARGRRTTNAEVREGYGEGRLVEARKAVELGMADAVGQLPDAVAEVRRLVLTSRSGAMSAADLSAGPAGAGGEVVKPTTALELERLRLRHELYRRV